MCQCFVLRLQTLNRKKMMATREKLKQGCQRSHFRCVNNAFSVILLELCCPNKFHMLYKEIREASKQN